MNEWWLELSFGLLILLALPLILYPLRKSKSAFIVLVPLLIIVLACSYWHWGAWPAWRLHLQDIANQQQVQTILQTMKGPADLVKRLKARLEIEPNNARGWYLLGRLYVSQNQWRSASHAFTQAKRIDPNEATLVNYGQSLWQLNKQQFNQPIRDLYEDLIQKNPHQPDALAMLALDAYTSHHYQRAIDYWQHLLSLAPDHSEETEMIRKAIAKAQSNLKEDANAL